MVGQQTIGQHPHRRGLLGLAEQSQEGGVIVFVPENGALVVATIQNVEDHPSRRNSCCSGLDLGRAGAHDPDVWYIGSDPDQADLVLDDDFVSPRHARIYRDDAGRWRVENLESLNGIWLKIKDARLGKGAEFQCGEQRFRLEIATRDDADGFEV